jgi:hypothetical protein
MQNRMCLLLALGKGKAKAVAACVESVPLTLIR